jgi:hypothetical protein
MRNLFDSAEHFLRTWERTVAASEAIQTDGIQPAPDGILRAAPKPSLIPGGTPIVPLAQ